MNPKLITMLGFAQKSGNLVSGTEQVLKAIESGKVRVCLLGNDVAEGTRKKVLAKCQHYQIPCHEILSTEALSQAIGKENRTVVGITDKRFSETIATLLKATGI